MKHAIILHNPVGSSSKADELDVFNQAELIETALDQLGYSSQRLAFNLNDIKLSKLLKSTTIAIVFNLVETINESGQYSFIVPGILELLKVPYSGSGAETIFLTTNKIICKTVLIFNKINTPVWATYPAEVEDKKLYIIKPISEDGSLGIDDDLIVQGNMITSIPSGYFAEEYIDGREFNISVIGGRDGFEVLPPAEMCFSNDYYTAKPKILGYKAKWDENSMEYQNTTRSFNFEQCDSELIAKLKEISANCWKIFNLKGYARIDVRVGSDGIPKVIEINANPCIAPDSGFVAASRIAGLSNAEIIKRIIDDAKSN